MHTTVAACVLSEAEQEAWMGRFPSAKDYDSALTLRTTGQLRRPDGTLLACLIKRGIQDDAGRMMYRAIHDKIQGTNNRGTASGQRHVAGVKADGTRSSTNRTPKAVRSSVIGYYDRYPRIPYCRRTAFNESHPERFAACVPAIQQADAALRTHAPDRWRAQRDMADQTHPDFLIQGTTFTTVTVNKNFRTAGHRDAGDLPQGFGVMTYYRSGKFEGGHLVFPAYRAAIALDTYDVLLFDAHEVHCNTAVRPYNDDWERITCVHYYRKNMYYCGSAAQELEIARSHVPGQGPRALRTKPGQTP